MSLAFAYTTRGRHVQMCSFLDDFSENSLLNFIFPASISREWLWWLCDCMYMYVQLRPSTRSVSNNLFDLSYNIWSYWSHRPSLSLGLFVADPSTFSAVSFIKNQITGAPSFPPETVSTFCYFVIFVFFLMFASADVIFHHQDVCACRSLSKEQPSTSSPQHHSVISLPVSSVWHIFFLCFCIHYTI